MLQDLPQFQGVIREASNINRTQGCYCECMFAEDFPQFFDGGGDPILPETMLEQFITLANAAITPDRWLEMWRYACGLYVAHYATLHLRTYKEFSASPAEAAASGSVTGVVKKATLGDSSVEYDTSSALSATASWGDLNETTYGQILASRARVAGMGGSYIL